MAKTTDSKLPPVTVTAQIHPSRNINGKTPQAGIPHTFAAWVPYVGKKVKVTIEVIDG